MICSIKYTRGIDDYYLYFNCKSNNYEDCKKIGLKVVKLESDSTLQDAVLSVHHSYVLSSYILPGALKFIENSQGQTFVISGKK